jgi:beta-phosphoglucomutase
MSWFRNYQLYLFDFDGLLVNTEELHLHAYRKMCALYGFNLAWNMATYCRYAMVSADALKKAIIKEFPDLMKWDWEILYKQKKEAYEAILEKETIALMPGAEALLLALNENQAKCCVVTNSPSRQVNLIRKEIPVLDVIQNWVTREDYFQPKPSSECYLKAIDFFSLPNKKVIGFEDSPRGLEALLGSGAEAVFVSQLFSKEEVSQDEESKFKHFPTLEDFYHSAMDNLL